MCASSMHGVPDGFVWLDSAMERTDIAPEHFKAPAKDGIERSWLTLGESAKIVYLCVQKHKTISCI